MANLTGTKWGADEIGTAGGVVTWSFVGANEQLATISSLGSGFGGLSVEGESVIAYDFVPLIRRAFDDWSDVGNIEFLQVADGGGGVGEGAVADIRIFFSGAPGGSDGYAFFPSANNALVAGDILLDGTSPIKFTPGYLTPLALHEIGHAIGLGHTFGSVIMNPNIVVSGLANDDKNGVRQIYGPQDGVPEFYVLPAAQSDLDMKYAPAGLTVLGNDLDNRIDGTGDVDAIEGAGGGDVLLGRDGDDRLDGDGGDDTLFGGNGDDILNGASGGDHLTGENGRDDMRGGSGADELRGGNGADTARGGDGADLILGNGGADDLAGGRWRDTIKGGNGADLINGNKGEDVLGGGKSSDRIFGGQGRDHLNGGDGDDILNGGIGRDLLYGGAGADVFVLGEVWGDDTIGDFEFGVDKLDFSRSGAGSFSDLKIADNSEGVVISHSGSTVALNGVAADSIGPSDFLF